MRIAIMQPYFIPYAGYFRLFAATDLFVVYDCVQFPRRGWVHRNRLPNFNHELDWLTLPLKKADRDIKISDLTFGDDALAKMQNQMTRFPLFKKDLLNQSCFQPWFLNFDQSPIEYIVKLLQVVCDELNIPFNVAYSSKLNLPAELTGQDRILAIAEHYKATHYINAPGGVDLYQAERFVERNINLQFLPEYQGGYTSILYRLLTEEPLKIQQEIYDQLTKR